MTTTTHPSLAAALAAFQMELPTIAKGNTAAVKSDKANYNYKYADLMDISTVALPLLGKHGLSWSTLPTFDEGGHFVLRYTLRHESGEQIDGTYPLPAANALPQAMGSAITYARRYALCAVTGVAPGGDDDDAQAAQTAAPARSRGASTRRPAAAPEPTPQATQDWAAQVALVGSIEDLRKVHLDVEQAQELGYVFPAEHSHSVEAVIGTFGLQPPPATVTVGQLIGAVKNAIEVQQQRLAAQAAAEAGESEGDAEETPEEYERRVAAEFMAAQDAGEVV